MMECNVIDGNRTSSSTVAEQQCYFFFLVFMSDTAGYKAGEEEENSNAHVLFSHGLSSISYSLFCIICFVLSCVDFSVFFFPCVSSWSTQCCLPAN